MQALPPLRCTFIQAFHLYRKSFIDVLPFILILTLGKYGIDYFIHDTEDLRLFFLIKPLIDIALTALLFSIIMKIVFDKTQSQIHPANQLILGGLKRALQVFIAYFLLSLPLFFTLGGIIYFQSQLPTAISENGILPRQMITLAILGLVLISTLLLYTFSFIAGVYIVIKECNAWNGLKQSWRVMASCWLDTLLLIIVLGMIGFTIFLLFDTFNTMASYIVTLLLGSFYPSIMIIRYNQTLEH